MNLAAIILLFCGAMVVDLAVGVDLSTRIDLSQQGLFEGDIILMPTKSRNGILATQRWPNNTIYYEYGTNWGQAQIDIIQAAFKEIQDNTCIKFVKRINEPDYISIYNGSGCSSPVGYGTNGKRLVSLQHSNQGVSCWEYSTVLHELLHTVGLWHEQSRYDRDDYIMINLDNVDYCMRYSFDIQPGSSSNTYGVPYNYLSVMHYDKLSFTVRFGGVTMATKDPNFMDKIGKVKQGAPSDYDKVNRIYQCGIYQNFVAPPVKLATSAPTAAGSCVNVDCSEQCPSLAANRACEVVDNMMKWCPKSCNYCPTAAQPTPPPTPTAGCADKMEEQFCKVWVSLGHCTQTPDFMNANCAKSCGCSTSTSTTACNDTGADCATWAANGFCKLDPSTSNIAQICPKSCGLCSGTGPATCADKEREQDCYAWAKLGQCTQFPDYMNANCAKSCGKC